MCYESLRVWVCVYNIAYSMLNLLTTTCGDTFSEASATRAHARKVSRNEYENYIKSEFKIAISPRPAVCTPLTPTHTSFIYIHTQSMQI